MENMADGVVPPKIEVDPHAGSAMAAQRKDDATRAREEREQDLRKARAKHPRSLVDRIRELLKGALINFTDIAAKDEDTGAVVYKYTEMNAYRIFDALFIGTEVSDIHFDTSRNAIVDERGEVINDTWSPRELMDAIQLCKLKATHGISSSTITRWLQTWAMSHRFNDISERARARLRDVENLEASPLLDTYLIEVLGLEDSLDNRMFSKYWCLSLYARIMYPGCLAPISMAMFGSMDAGKSHFQRMVCRELLCDEHAAPVTFNLDRDHKDLMRDIYGISIIATIPEMAGFYRLEDVRKLKAVMTETTDTFDKKFKDTSRRPRQFIFCLDSNRYTGLYRDGDDEDAAGNTRGERRWFPVFVGQLPGQEGREGEVRWNETFRVDFGPAFAERLWAMMKVCEQWFDHHGMDEYVELVHSTTEMVKEFSRREKVAGEGVIKDDTLDEKFPKAVYRAVYLYGTIGELHTKNEHGTSVKVRGLIISHADLLSAYSDMGRREISPKRLTMKIKLMDDLIHGTTGVKKAKFSGFCFVDADTFSNEDRFSNGKGGRDEFCSLFCEKYLPEGTDAAEAWMTSQELVKHRGNDGF